MGLPADQYDVANSKAAHGRSFWADHHWSTAFRRAQVVVSPAGMIGHAANANSHKWPDPKQIPSRTCLPVNHRQG